MGQSRVSGEASGTHRAAIDYSDAIASARGGEEEEDEEDEEEGWGWRGRAECISVFLSIT
jgi:hypothetical protein